jgi:hypothetical protein
MTNVLKWTATAILICGFGLFSSGVSVGWYLQILGGLLWLAAGIRMGDRPIILTNAVMTVVGIIGKFFL